jgi:hypothetical protein
MRRLAPYGVAVIVAACSAADGSTAESESRSAPEADVHPGWFKTPEAIAQTITWTWELSLSAQEEDKYLGGLRAALGGVSVAQHGSLVDRPHELFALAANSLGIFLSEKLARKQIEKTQAGEPYLFDGLGFAEPDDGCYADDAMAWCDAIDGIVIGDLTARRIDPNVLTKEIRKRLMHNMQDIGEFFLMAIDERTMMAGRHAPEFLLDEVFLPKLREAPLSVEQERAAWQEVVATVLLGGYFLELPAGR